MTKVIGTLLTIVSVVSVLTAWETSEIRRLQIWLDEKERLRKELKAALCASKHPAALHSGGN